MLETKRLILRELTTEDAEKFYELNSDPEVIRYTGDVPFRTIDQARNFLTDYKDYRKNGFGRWAVIEKTTQEFIGWCGLKLNEQDLVDIGFRFFRNYWGFGYATESASACLNYGFDTLKLTIIIGRSARANKASIRILEKLNMSFWKAGSCEGIEDAVYYRKRKR